MTRTAAVQSFSEAINRFTTIAEIATGMDVPYATVMAWRIRDYVPPAYWNDFVAFARSAGVRGISRRGLVQLGEARAVERLRLARERRQDARAAREAAAAASGRRRSRATSPFSPLSTETGVA